MLHGSLPGKGIFGRLTLIIATAISAMSFSSISVAAVELPAPTENSDYYFNGRPPAALIELGRNLFFDKIMSGNQNISCATCHSPLAAGSDGLSLGVGEGGRGLGAFRDTGVGEDAIENRVGRHAPHLFNLGAKEFVRLNWNGIHQISDTDPNELNLPSGVDTPEGLDNVLAGQALFPIVNLTEMLGQGPENEISILAQPGDNRFPPLWDQYVARLQANENYVRLFSNAFSDVAGAGDITIAHYANAVGAFQAFAFRSDNSPFDQFLRGNTDALSDQQIRGMELFYGDAGCSSCHSGVFQTDHQFHAIAMPQIGPGPEARFPLEDRGRAEATGLSADFAKFRTPSLRNVWLTKPYGHSGAYNSLRAVVEHHLDPITSLNNYNTRQIQVPSRDDLDAIDLQGYEDPVLRERIIAANRLEASSLTRTEVNDILEFLRALTDWNTLDMKWMVPGEVPSGLPVYD